MDEQLFEEGIAGLQFDHVHIHPKTPCHLIRNLHQQWLIVFDINHVAFVQKTLLDYLMQTSTIKVTLKKIVDLFGLITKSWTVECSRCSICRINNTLKKQREFICTPASIEIL